MIRLMIWALWAATVVCVGLALMSLFMAVTGHRVCLGCAGDSVDGGDRPLVAVYGLGLALVAGFSGAATRFVETPSGEVLLRPRPLGAMARVGTGAAALPAALVGLYGLLLALFFVALAAQRPDSSVPDGEPCCPHPDTWGEVVGGVAAAVLPGVAAGGLVLAGLALAWTAVTGRAPRRVARRGPLLRAAVGMWVLALTVSVSVFVMTSGADYP